MPVGEYAIEGALVEAARRERMRDVEELIRQIGKQDQTGNATVALILSKITAEL